MTALLFRIGACGRRLGSGPQAGAGSLDDARSFAGEAAQVIELRPADHPATHYFDHGDPRRIKRKDAFNSLAVGDLAQGEVRVDAGVLAGDANSFEGLDALALAFDHPDHDPHRIARLEFRHRPIGDELFDLLALDLLKKIHHSTSRSLSPARGPGPPPPPDPPMIARHQHLRHRAPLPQLGPRILGILEQALREALLGERLEAPANPGPKPPT